MALLENVPSILLFAIDLPIEEKDGEGKDKADDIKVATPNDGGEVSEKEALEKNTFLDRILLTDSVNKQIRIPIPIDDRILPAHHTGNSSNMNKFTDYDNKNIAIEPSENGVSLTFEIKNNLTGLSTAADIFSALAGKSRKLFSTTPRVSFFGSNIAIFNAYLTGLSRQTVKGSDQEMITLSLDYAPPETEDPAAPDEQPLTLPIGG